MRKLLVKTALFIIPFFLIFLFSFKFYTTEKGDLYRLGYIADVNNYDAKKVFKSEYNRKVKFSLFSNLDLNLKQHFNAFTIGDSFSEQGIISYQNYLTDNSNINVLHYDRFLHENPIETLTGFLNGNVLDNLQVDYIILQSVERAFVNRGIAFNKNIKITNDSLMDLISKHKKNALEVVKEKTKDNFFCRETLKLPLYTINYFFDDNAYSSPTYQVKVKNNMFSSNNNKLFFFEDDLKILNVNNEFRNINTLNIELNILAKRLKTKGIKLIVLPCPDKLDFYYDNIVNKTKYPRPIFYDFMRKLKKDYIYLDTKQILREKTKNKKDVYFYDDTHWSPISAKIIGKELDSIITKK